MDYFAPLGPVYQAGTLSGNPLAMAAGIAALDELQSSSAYSIARRAASAAGNGDEGRRQIRGRSGPIQPVRFHVLRLLHFRAGV